MKKVVIALGGNAIQKEKGPATAQAQQQICQETAKKLLAIIQSGYEVVITHGNGPQVGNIILQQQAADSERTPAMPIDTCGAMSQGMVGYWLQQALDRALDEAGIHKRAATVITQSVVDPDDPAFQQPVKPIGPFYSEAEARAIMQEKGFLFKEDAGRGWRRVVPSPRPIDIVEKEIILDLIQQGHIVVSVGGGGIPVVSRPDGSLQGVEAVIDKDLGAEKLAELVQADILLILTAVDQVTLNYRQPNEKNLYEVTAEKMKEYMQEGHFAPGSMLPKVQAAIAFAESKPGRVAIITSLDHAYEALQGQVGTRVTAAFTSEETSLPRHCLQNV